MGVEGLRINAEQIGRLCEGVEAVAVGVDADLGVVCKVLLKTELAGEADGKNNVVERRIFSEKRNYNTLKIVS